MKKLLIILPLLFACKSSKKIDCDAYGNHKQKTDTTTVVKIYQKL
jgi:hypothetical protein